MACDTDCGQMWRRGGQRTPEPNPRSRVTRGPFVAAPGRLSLFVVYWVSDHLILFGEIIKLQAFKCDLDWNNKFIVNSKITFRHLDRLPRARSKSLKNSLEKSKPQSIPVYPDPYIELHIFGLLKQKRFEMIFCLNSKSKGSLYSLSLAGMICTSSRLPTAEERELRSWCSPAFQRRLAGRRRSGHRTAHGTVMSCGARSQSNIRSLQWTSATLDLLLSSSKNTATIFYSWFIVLMYEYYLTSSVL